MNYLIAVFRWTITLFEIISIILFIKDGIASKKEGRGRKTGYTVMFIISMVFLGLEIIFTVLTLTLASLIMRSM